MARRRGWQVVGVFVFCFTFFLGWSILGDKGFVSREKEYFERCPVLFEPEKVSRLCSSPGVFLYKRFLDDFEREYMVR